MQPRETGFVAPVIDCFNPKKICGVVGVKYAADFAEILNKENDSCFSENNQNILLPRSSINAAYVNDLGGISLEFSPDVVYDGNYLGSVMLKVPPYYVETPLAFGYDGIARVRKVGGLVIWENSDVPENRKVFRTK